MRSGEIKFVTLPAKKTILQEPMKRKTFFGLSAAMLGVMPAFSATVETMNPPMWWTGMNEKQLQIAVSGEGIRDAVPEINYPGVHIDSVARLDSPNYQFIYVTVGDDAKPGTMEITFKTGKKKIKKNYELLARDRKAEEYVGFDSSDALYLMMPDRFSDGDPSNNENESLQYNVKTDRNDPNGRHGGDLKGILNHLDYLQELGITAIWLTPVLENDMPGGSYHGYATTNYYRVDPRFGTNEEYKQLIEECHRRGIRVVMDMIFNHCGIAHPWMADMPSKDWFNSPVELSELEKLKSDFSKMPKGYKQTNFRLNTNHDPYGSKYDLGMTVDGWFSFGMPDLNQRNHHLMTYLIQNSIWWIEYAKVNGIRMDTYPYADMAAMAEWNRRVAKEYPNFNIVGESWLHSEMSIAYMQSGNKFNPMDTELKTVMDFPFLNLCRPAFTEKTLPWGEGLNRLYDHLALDFVYSNPRNLLIFLDNHDTDRFLLEKPENLGSWKQAQTFLLTSRGIPQIYYGTELLMFGNKKVTDGHIRLDMPGGFPGDNHSEFVAEGRTAQQNEAWNFMSRLLNWRKVNKAVSEGKTLHYMPSNGFYVYERKAGDSRVVVLMNGTDDEAKAVDMSRYYEIMKPGDVFTDVITGKKVTIGETMDFAPRAVYVLE